MARIQKKDKIDKYSKYMKRAPMIFKGVRITIAMMEKLDKISERKGMSFSELVRKALLNTYGF